MKTLVDSYRDVKFLVSGSAAAALNFKSKESGAGRFTDFFLPALTFYEFITMQDKNELMLRAETSNSAAGDAPDMVQFNQLFLDYINYGGYPESIFSLETRSDPTRFIRNDVIDKVLLRDLPSLYGISDVQGLNALFTTIAYNTANEFSLELLGAQSGVPKNTIKKQLEYLEAAFLIRIVRRVDQSGKRFQRENFFKVYLSNPSIKSALFSPLTLEDEGTGQMIETAIYAQWFQKQGLIPWYARWAKGEVDMVSLSRVSLKPVEAVEVKWSDRYVSRPSELKSLMSFCRENGLKAATVTSISIKKTVTFEGVTITFVPASLYAYQIGSENLA